MERFLAMRAEYERHGVKLNVKKSTLRSFHHTVWGGEVDGLRGTTSSPKRRALCLAAITLQVITLGVASVALLEILNGSWVATLMHRRRMLCILDLRLNATRGRSQKDIVALSRELKFEYFALVLLVPFARTNMRAAPAPFVYAVDASDWGTAVCRASLSRAQSLELCRHAVVRGAWTRLLGASQSWLRAHGILPP